MTGPHEKTSAAGVAGEAVAPSPRRSSHLIIDLPDGDVGQDAAECARWFEGAITREQHLAELAAVEAARAPRRLVRRAVGCHRRARTRRAATRSSSDGDSDGDSDPDHHLVDHRGPSGRVSSFGVRP